MAKPLLETVSMRTPAYLLGSSENHDLFVARYVEGLLYNLDYYIQYHSQEGIDELNTVVPTHTITMNASNDVGSYCGAKVVDGKLALLFNPTALGVNINNMGQSLEKTINAAPQQDGTSPLPYAARHSIKTDYTAKVDELLEKARKQLENQEFKFEPDFEVVAAKLKGGKDVRDDWENNIGSFVLEYFSSLVSYLEYEKFGSDDMLREGLAEAVPKNQVRFRIVDKLQTQQNGYNEIVLDEDELVIQVCPYLMFIREIPLTNYQTTADKFGTNIYNSCAKIVDIL